MWTPQWILVGLLIVAEVALILFGITLIVVAGFYVFRVAISSLVSTPFIARKNRAILATDAGKTALLALVCGPIVAFFCGLATLPMLMTEPGFGFVAFIPHLLLVTGLGALAGIIAGGAFWASSALLGRVRKTVKKFARRGVWDPELDGLA